MNYGGNLVLSLELFTSIDEGVRVCVCARGDGSDYYITMEIGMNVYALLRLT